MWQKNIRIRNKLLQILYRPPATKNVIFSPRSLSIFDELDKTIETKITPLLADLFN